MNRDDIIEMAKKSCDSDKVDAWHNGFWTLTQEELERFAALVAAAEKREWVGLTEIEICDIEADELTSANSETFSFARAIEYKLKEKNNVLR